jgi:hypothetical protein
MNKLIIAGSRTFDNYRLLSHEVKKFIVEVIGSKKNLEIVSGEASGADSLGIDFAVEHWIPVQAFPADWEKHGKAAGPIRNEEMAKYANYCIVFWDGKSPGSKNMIENCKKYNLKYKVIIY